MSNCCSNESEKHIDSPLYLFPLSQKKSVKCVPFESCADSLSVSRSQPVLSTSCEIVCACVASLVTTVYTLHHGKRIRAFSVDHAEPESRILAFDPGHFSFILDPSPALMLSSCLILGCAISSYAYRRQEQDSYQTLILLTAIGAASAIGLVAGVDVNLIMLGLIPWALCLAMVLSSWLHWLLRRHIDFKSLNCCDIDETKVLLSCWNDHTVLLATLDKPNDNPRSIVIHVEHADNIAQTISPPPHPKGRLYVWHLGAPQYASILSYLEGWFRKFYFQGMMTSQRWYLKTRGFYLL